MINLRKFNKLYVLTEILNNYNKTFPEVGLIPTVVASYGFGKKGDKDFFDIFVCMNTNGIVVGFAVYFVSKNILRFYDHEGSDIGLETDMEYVPIKKGKYVDNIKRE